MVPSKPLIAVSPDTVNPSPALIINGGMQSEFFSGVTVRTINPVSGFMKGPAVAAKG
jgi:hypothetical protein